MPLYADTVGHHVGPAEASETYGDAPSHQVTASDLNLDSAAGKSSGTAFLAAQMGNLLGNLLTKTKNYLGGLIGHYSITGAGASTYPKGAVLAGIGDGSIDADGAVVAYIDGDGGGLTTAGAAFKVRSNNSTAGNSFSYGMDLSDPSHDGYLPVSYLKGEVRMSNGQEIYTGSATTRAAVLAQVGLQGAIGSIYASSAGKQYVKVANANANTDWQLVTTTAAD